MKRFKKVTVVIAVVAAFSAIAAGGASADGSFSGVLTGDTAIATIDCGFSMDYTGDIGAGQTATMDAASFTGEIIGTHAACDPSSLTIDDDVDVDWGGTDTAATVEPFTVTVNEFGCDYTVDDPIGFSSDDDASGTWSGEGSASGDSFPCSFLDADVSLSDGVFS